MLLRFLSWAVFFVSGTCLWARWEWIVNMTSFTAQDLSIIYLLFGLWIFFLFYSIAPQEICISQSPLALFKQGQPCLEVWLCLTKKCLNKHQKTIHLLHIKFCNGCLYQTVRYFSLVRWEWEYLDQQLILLYTLLQFCHDSVKIRPTHSPDNTKWPPFVSPSDRLWFAPVQQPTVAHLH